MRRLYSAWGSRPRTARRSSRCSGSAIGWGRRVAAYLPVGIPHVLIDGRFVIEGGNKLAHDKGYVSAHQELNSTTMRRH